MADGVALYLDGTVGSRDSTLAVSESDAETYPIEFTNVGAVRDVYYQSKETYRRSTTPLSVTCPSQLKVSFDGGETYGSSGTGELIDRYNSAFKLKQVAPGLAPVNITVAEPTWADIADGIDLAFTLPSE